MNKREFLKLLPMAAVAATTVKVGDVEAKAHELQSKKKYLMVLKGGFEPENAVLFARIMREKLGPNVTVVGVNDGDVEMYELP